MNVENIKIKIVPTPKTFGAERLFNSFHSDRANIIAKAKERVAKSKNIDVNDLCHIIDEENGELFIYEKKQIDGYWNKAIDNLPFNK